MARTPTSEQEQVGEGDINKYLRLTVQFSKPASPTFKFQEDQEWENDVQLGGRGFIKYDIEEHESVAVENYNENELDENVDFI